MRELAATLISDLAYTAILYPELIVPTGGDSLANS